MMSKHTPGPWLVQESRSGKSHYNIIGTHLGFKHKIAIVPFMTDLVTCGVAEKLKQEALADATVIHAATDLLEALELLVHYHLCEQEGISSGQPTSTQWLEAVERASEAINKAKGVSNG